MLEVREICVHEIARIPSSACSFEKRKTETPRVTVAVAVAVVFVLVLVLVASVIVVVVRHDGEKRYKVRGTFGAPTNDKPAGPYEISVVDSDGRTDGRTAGNEKSSQRRCEVYSRGICSKQIRRMM